MTQSDKLTKNSQTEKFWAFVSLWGCFFLLLKISYFKSLAVLWVCAGLMWWHQLIRIWWFESMKGCNILSVFEGWNICEFSECVGLWVLWACEFMNLWVRKFVSSHVCGFVSFLSFNLLRKWIFEHKNWLICEFMKVC